MRNIFFTLCSNNYLAQAKVLGDSVLKYVPASLFVIGLVDYQDPKVDYGFFNGMNIIPFDQLGFSEFDDMLSRYNVIEFNTSVKPFYIEYLWSSYGKNNNIIYLDPDILLYRPLDHVFKSLRENSIVLTPMFSKVPELTSLDELVALRHGMFNLGFIALKYSEESIRLVRWWKERLRTHCLIDKPRGIFVDQKWMDLAPLLFEGVYILKHPGYNMAWWNFSERVLIDTGRDYMVNNNENQLYFFHFSGFKPRSEYITGRSGESQFEYASRPELRRLASEYENVLFENRYEFFNGLKPKVEFFSAKISWKRKMKESMKKLIHKVA